MARVVSLLFGLATIGVIAQPARVFAQTERKPEALVRAEMARVELATARIEYQLIEKAGPDSPDVAARPRFFSFRAALDDFCTTNNGDSDGVVVRNENGEPGKWDYAGPVHTLVKGAECWRHVERDPAASVYEGDVHGGALDIRRLGLNPASDRRDLGSELNRLGYPPLKYSEEREGDLHVVTAASRNGAVRWWIDPAKGWGIVKTAVLMNGNVIGETRYDLRLVDGYWFPCQMERVRMGAGDAEPSTRVKVLAAEINRPEHPLALTPVDIGVEVGTQINYEDGRQPSVAFWDGREAVSHESLAARIAAGELAIGPTVAREHARLRARSEAVEVGQPASAEVVRAPRTTSRYFESEWEAYTRRFVEHFHLGAEQRERASTILKDCQSRASEYVGRRADELGRLERELATLREQTAGKAATVRSEWERLLAPIGAIFDEQLKPRLDAIPTRAQRSEAGEFR